MFLNVFNSSMLVNSNDNIEYFKNISNLNILDFLISSLINYLQKFQTGLTLQDLKNFMFVITFLRFIIYSLFYNVKTGFYISCISLAAAGLWYLHLRFVIESYASLLTLNKYTTNLWFSYQKQKSIDTSASTKLRTITLFQKIIGNNGNSYRIDPLSMFFSVIPVPLKIYSDRIYYTLYDTIGPMLGNVIAENSFVNRITFFYLILARYGKKRCPYLIRWHWTYIMLYTIVSVLFYNIPYRIEGFSELILLPQYRMEEYYMAKVLSGTFMGFHIICVVLPLLHALIGQYFYVPFLTENVEIHIGKRPKNSIYSGGYTAWQDFSVFLNIQDLIAPGTKSAFPRLWWGWFGRGDNPLVSKNRQRKRWKIFKSLKKFLTKLFGFAK